MKRHLQYLKYIIKHKWYVLISCRLAECSIWRGIIHDWDKFLPREWFPYVNSFYKKAPDGSTDPTKVSKEFDYAWLYHQKINAHHWQYWVLINDENGTYPLAMPEKYIREMVADWIGAGRACVNRKNPLPWYNTHKHKMILEKETKIKLEQILYEIDAILKEGKYD